MTKIGKKLTAVFLAIAVAVTVIPISGTQTVYADDFPAFSQQVEVDGNLVSVEAPEGLFPADAILDVSKVTDEEVLGKAGEALDEIREGSDLPDFSYVFDIRVSDAQGEILELAEGQTIDISIALSEEVDEGLDASLCRITDTGDDTAWEAAQQDSAWDAETNTLEFNTDRLSLYALEFTAKSTQESADQAETDQEETDQEETDQEETALRAAGQKAGDQETADVTVDSWSALQNAVNSAPDDTRTVIALSTDCTASSGQDRIQIPENKIIELDLAGHKLNRNRTSSHSDGHVIEVFGDLTITDSTADENGMNGKGVITGGFASNGGGINIAKGAACELKGGTIKGNKASTNGGGVHVHGTFKMSGGSISDNETTGDNANGGGIYVNGNDGATLTTTGGLISSNTTQTNNDKGGHGGGIMVTSGANVFITDVEIRNNSSRKHGAALYTEASIDIDRCVFEVNYTIASSSQRVSDQFNINTYFKLADTYDGGAIYLTNGAELNISNTTFKNNRVTNWAWQDRHASGGAIYVNSGTLNISNSAFEDNTSWEGGAIYSKSGTTVSAVKTEFTNNKVGITRNYSDSDARDKIPVESKGGGAISSYGTLTLEGCTITGNHLTNEKDGAKGGGIYSEGTLAMNNVTCSDNNGRIGGGVYVKGTFNVEGKTIINDNTSWTGNDVYLSSGKVITLTGPLGSDSDIGVALENKYGVFTNNFTVQHPVDIPETFFYSCDGYEVILKDNEGYIQRGTLDDAGKFIGWKDWISPNPNRLNGPNWMSGLSGERYLNEINIPGSHDASMNNVSSKGCLSGKIGKSQAKTQEEYINEQLEHGIRFFDIRMKAKYCSRDVKIGAVGVGLALPAAFIPVIGTATAIILGTVGGVMLLNDSDLPIYKDDGKNLWTCHGRSAAGTFYALDQNGDNLSLAKELEWMKAFLRDHPTETIIIDYRPETDDVGGSEFYEILDRFNVIMEELTNEKNPSTGESYVYWEDGKVGKRFTHWPKLKDCRGKIVLWAKLDETANKSGGIWRDVDGIKTKEAEGNYQDGADRAPHLLKFFDEYKESKIPRNAMNGQMKEFYWVTMNTTDTSFMQTPIELAKNYVLPRVFGSEGVVNESKKGTYFGWFGIDAVKENYSRDVWITNFPDDLEYCIVTVESGLSGSDAPETQTYKLLRGTTITIPGCIYDGTKADKFLGWEANVDGKVYTLNNTYQIVENVTFTAKWADQIQTPVTVVWKDADNLDEIRPDNLVISYEYDGTKEETVEASKNWTGMLTGDFTGNPTVEAPSGYTATAVVGSKGKEGYTITMTHTPDVSVKASGTVIWADRDNMDHIRPDSVTLHLYANGTEEVASGTVSADDGWKFDLGTHPRYKNGELVAYRLAEEEIAVNEEDYLSGYTIGVDPVSGERNAITSFNVTNTHEVITSVMYARVEWDDDNDAAGKRPESVNVRWMKNGEPYGDGEWIVLEPGDEGEWVVGLEITYAEMKEIAAAQYELAQKYEEEEITAEEFLKGLEDTMLYTIEQKTVDGYGTTIQFKEGEETEDGRSGSYFQILNTYGKRSLTFYKDSEGTEVWQTKVVNDGASIKRFEEFGMTAPDLLEKEGYAFAGWANEKNVIVDSYCDKNGNLNQELDGKLVDWDTLISDNMEFYPIWIRDRVHVTIVRGGEDPDGDDVIIDEAQALDFTVNIGEKIAMRYLAEAARDGYRLDGWYTNDGVLWNGENWETLDYVSDGWTEEAGWEVTPDYCDKDESDKPVMSTNLQRRFNYYTMTLTAKWVKQHKITFDTDGGEPEPKDQIVDDGGTAEKPADPPKKTGYAFAEWFMKTEEVIADTAFDFTTLIKEDTDLKAKWDANKYKVKFDENTGSGEMSDQSFTYDVDQALTANAFTKTGYTFTGWNTKADGSGDPYKDEQSVRNLSSEDGVTVTLYAQWDANKYKVKFDENTGSGEMSDQSFTYDADQALTANAFNKTGHTFTGWNTKADGSGDPYKDKDSVRNLSSEDGATVTLYAQWKANKYKVTYKYLGKVPKGASKLPKASEHDYGSEVTVADDATAPGYKFSGWSREDFTMPAEVVEITGTFTANGNTPYKVEHYKENLNGGYTLTDIEELTGKTDTKATANPKSYKGFSLNGSAKGTMKSGNIAGDGSLLLKLFYDRNKYEITYDLNGGKYNGRTKKIVETYSYETNIIIRIAPTRKGYEFLYWKGSQYQLGDSYTVEEDHTLTAQWKAHKNKVKFDKNTGSGEMSDQSFTYDADQALPASAFTKTGYTFIGWNTKADGSGDSYTDEQSVRNLSSEDGATVTLYAQWRANKYKVKFDKNTGSGKMSDQLFTYDAGQALTAGSFTKTGYTFTGWNTKADGSGEPYTDEQSVRNLSSEDGATVTLYAQWKAVAEDSTEDGSGSSDKKENDKDVMTGDKNHLIVWMATALIALEALIALLTIRIYRRKRKQK